MAPEYVREGYLTVKANVFSLGVVTLEIVGGNARNKIEREEGVRVVAEVIDILRGYKQPQWRGRGYQLAALTPESTGDFESDFPIDSEAGDEWGRQLVASTPLPRSSVPMGTPTTSIGAPNP
ncbi:hypothetical protein CRG98_034941 [Punica granatum]|uniref:Serine-threonine/tyrosine-protein kinase catalytic domain-containing protein n=1 Tax=Punica granatum TaxID=22663 RepID=A0A2I0IMI7_PUNGR|nr:hypothetical protein CRG98_034941 [Punica granatum]